MKRLISFVCFIVISSCRPQVKFDRAKWIADDGESKHGERELMVDDLLKNHQIKGLNYKQIINKLGPTANWEDKNGMVGYSIVVDYGSDIDPVYSRSLVITLDKDSIAQSVKIEEWKKK